jgi:hypothetical protein
MVQWEQLSVERENSPPSQRFNASTHDVSPVFALRFPVFFSPPGFLGSCLKKVFNRQRPDLLSDCHEQHLAFLPREFFFRRVFEQVI